MLRQKLVDAVDLLHQRMCNLVLPPYSLRARTGLIEDYERVPQEYLAYFKLLCELEMDHNILDIGCGPGRFASPLLKAPNLLSGQYCGFDLHPASIKWAQNNITAQHSNFQFSCIDLYNSTYNPSGTISPETFVFPYTDETFDFTFAISVFTHLLPGAGNQYLRELSRVLKPGSKAFFTCFLLQSHPDELTGTSKDTLGTALLKRINASGTWCHRGDYSVISNEWPEALVAFQETYLRTAVNDAGLKVQQIRQGGWNDASPALSFQDIVIVVK